jgi:hypothetical protein
LTEAFQEWLAARPESPFFCHSQRVARSKTKLEGPTVVTKN